jgi:hypothetical protein
VMTTAEAILLLRGTLETVAGLRLASSIPMTWASWKQLRPSRGLRSGKTMACFENRPSVRPDCDRSFESASESTHERA